MFSTNLCKFNLGLDDSPVYEYGFYSMADERLGKTDQWHHSGGETRGHETEKPPMVEMTGCQQ
jgi:hypothetical protein